ncbi:hypothetical protein BOX15_Mlig022978g2, partial [Macrostomum lignano]
TSSATVVLATSAETFESALASAKPGGLCLLHFRADWAAQCVQMSLVMDELAKEPAYSAVTFVNVEAEQVPQVTSRFGVLAVPTFLLVRRAAESQQPQVMDRLNGADPAALAAKLSAAVSATAPATGGDVAAAPKETQAQLEARLKSLLTRSPVLLFMKGSPDAPRCGFSRQIVELLRKHAEVAPFDHFDILTDQAVREGLKKLSNWPTYPQLYAAGELLGGLDVVREMDEAGELGPALKAAVTARLEKLVKAAPVMLFMKGSPDAPRCGFSRQIVELLRSEGVQFGHFDILQDNSVREGLKKFSNWPTFPQLYADGQLLGGLDIVREMQQAGELKESLPASCRA